MKQATKLQKDKMNIILTYGFKCDNFIKSPPVNEYKVSELIKYGFIYGEF